MTEHTLEFSQPSKITKFKILFVHETILRMETTNDKAGAMLETLKSEIGEKPVSLQLKTY